MKKHLCCLFFLSFLLTADAAQPTWVITTLNNIRRATQTALKAKAAGRALYALGKCKNALPDDEIKQLAQIASKPNGLKEVNVILGNANFIGRYGREVGDIVLQDTYLRIAVQNGRLSSKMATEALEHLGGTPGMTSLLSKINSSSLSQAKGHMRELEIALNAQKRGFVPVSLGQKFADGLKKGDTDLDVLLHKNGKNFAIESKAYASAVPNDMIRADAESLLSFCKEIDARPIFCFETPPSLFSQYFLTSKGIMCLIGDSDEIVAKLDIVSSLK